CDLLPRVPPAVHRARRSGRRDGGHPRIDPHRHGSRVAADVGMARLARPRPVPPPALARDAPTRPRCGSRPPRRAARGRAALTPSADVAWVLDRLWAPIVAVTAAP